jgi:3-oxoacyl-[acyl-carrier-protein] synthase III
MKIESISARIPSLELSNEQILDDLGRYNPDLPETRLKRYQRQVAYLLKKSGSRTRFIRDRENGETAVDLVKSAMAEALKEADACKSEIDLLIFCGVGKGFLEPANAYFYANAMDMNCQCFDISDACMGWTRSLEIAYMFLKFHPHRHVMVINGEFTAYEYGYPVLFRIKHPKQIEYTFPAYTIGEAATATILSGSHQDWSFDYDSAPELVDLCTIPLKGYEDFCEKRGNHGLNGIYGFVSYGGEIFDSSIKRLVSLVRQKVKEIDRPDIWFPHVASSNACLEAGNILGIHAEKLYVKAFPVYGNLVSASIPVAMNMAISEKKLVRGDRVVLCPASAGMVFAVVQFVF